MGLLRQREQEHTYTYSQQSDDQENPYINIDQFPEPVENPEEEVSITNVSRIDMTGARDGDTTIPQHGHDLRCNPAREAGREETPAAPPVQPPVPRRGRGRPRRTPLRIARDPTAYKTVQPHRLPELKIPGNCCRFCQAYRWREERPIAKPDSWSCCNNGLINTPCPDYVPGDEDASSDIHKLMYEVNPETGKLSKRCKRFRKDAVRYNNALAWTSEAIDNGHVDEAVGAFTFRVQGTVCHKLGPLIHEHGKKPQFAQIYNIDASQEALDARMDHNNGIDRDILHRLQTVLKQMNPFVNALKDCATRVLEGDDPDQARVVLKQCLPSRADRGTHNHPTCDEVATVMTGMDNIEHKTRLERDIVVETREGGLQRISYSHSSYFPLRYPLMFPSGEAG